MPADGGLSFYKVDLISCIGDFQSCLDASYPSAYYERVRVDRDNFCLQWCVV